MLQSLFFIDKLPCMIRKPLNIYFYVASKDVKHQLHVHNYFLTITAAPPSRPTKPDIMSKTTNSIRISFYVEFGTQPITYFLLNVTQSETGSELQKRFGLDERKYIDSLTEKRDHQGVVIGYTVAMFVTGLRERTMYEFEVAAASSIGVGEFSEPSEGTRLGEFSVEFSKYWICLINPLYTCTHLNTPCDSFDQSIRRW